MKKLIEEQKKRIRYMYTWMFRRYRTNTLADGGSIRSESITTDYLKMAQNNRIDKSIRFGWLGEAGSKITSGRVEKLYDINCFEQLGSELVTNGTDLVDSNADGLADGIILSQPSSNSIVTGNGFTGNAQRVSLSISYNNIFVFNSPVVGKIYKVRFKYRSSAPLAFRFSQGSGFIQYPINTGTASLVERKVTFTSGNELCALFSYTTPAATIGDWIEIGEISIKEVLNATNTNNATQTTPNSRPYLTGNIAPNEKLGLKNPNGGSNFMTHPTISFAANESWSVTTVFNNKNNKITVADRGRIYGGGYRTALMITFDVNSIGFTTDNDTLITFPINLSKYIGKTTSYTLVYNGSTLTLFINGVVVDTPKTVNSSAIFSNLLKSYPTDQIIENAKCDIKSHIIRSQALTQAQVTAEYNFLRSVYPEIESVVIGTQTWATSNCEMAATPQGNVIQEIQANGNVEKMTNTGIGGTTDWVDTNADGLADGMGNEIGLGGIYSIVTGNGFTGNAQKLTFSGVIPNWAAWIEKLSAGLIVGKYYKVSLKYRSSRGIVLSAFNNTQLPINTGNAVSFTYYGVCTTSRMLFTSISNTVANDYNEIDELSVQEIGWSGSQELYDGIYAQTAEAASSVEKVLNGGFDTDSGWSKGSGWTISGGKASCNGTSSTCYQNNSLVVGRYYKITYTISDYISGSFRVYAGGYGTVSGALRNANGTYTEYLYKWGESSVVEFESVLFNGSVDNLSVKELGLSDATSIANYTYAAVKAAGMWCHYNNSVDNGAIYGKLYNWFAVKLLQMDIDKYNTANPTALWGWRVPTQADFQTLSTYLGGDSVSGGKMKLAGTTYWGSPNTGADNSSGFSILPNGGRWQDGGFNFLLSSSYMHAIDNGGSYNIQSNSASFNSSTVQGNLKGFSLRFIKT